MLLKNYITWYFISGNSDYFLSNSCKRFSWFRVPFSTLKIFSSAFWYGSVAYILYLKTILFLLICLFICGVMGNNFFFYCVKKVHWWYLKAIFSWRSEFYAKCMYHFVVPLIFYNKNICQLTSLIWIAQMIIRTKSSYY